MGFKRSYGCLLDSLRTLLHLLHLGLKISPSLYIILGTTGYLSFEQILTNLIAIWQTRLVPHSSPSNTLFDFHPINDGYLIYSSWCHFSQRWVTNRFVLNGFLC